MRPTHEQIKDASCEASIILHGHINTHVQDEKYKAFLHNQVDVLLQCSGWLLGFNMEDLDNAFYQRWANMVKALEQEAQQLKEAYEESKRKAEGVATTGQDNQPPSSVD